MTGKHFGWHKHWRRNGARLVHDSGLAVEYDPELGWMDGVARTSRILWDDGKVTPITAQRLHQFVCAPRWRRRELLQCEAMGRVPVWATSSASVSL